MWNAIIEQAALGNFSFFILAVNVVQLAIGIAALAVAVKLYRRR